MMAKYRKKPQLFDAIEFAGYNVSEVLIWAGQWPNSNVWIKVDIKGLIIKSFDQEILVKEGDMIIHIGAGEFNCCKRKSFEQTYEKVED